jgi:hypothetical protein
MPDASYWGTQGPCWSTTLLQGGPWTERDAVEPLMLVVEVYVSVPHVSDHESFNSAVNVATKPVPNSKETWLISACSSRNSPHRSQSRSRLEHD